MHEICELTEMDLEAVAGGDGFINLPITVQTSIENNIPVQTAVATGIGGSANAGNLIGGLGNFTSQLKL